MIQPVSQTTCYTHITYDTITTLSTYTTIHTLAQNNWAITVVHHTVNRPALQCESKKVPPLRFSGIFSQIVRNFSIKFYVPIIRSYLHWTINFYLIICNFDEVMPY